MLEEKEQKMGNYINYCENENQMDIDNKSKTFVDKNKSDTFKKQYGFLSKKKDSLEENRNINRINNNDANNEITEEKDQEEEIYNNIYFPDTDYADKDNFYGEDFNYDVEVNRSFASYHASHNQTSENFTEKMTYKTEVTNDNTNK